MPRTISLSFAELTAQLTAMFQPLQHLAHPDFDPILDDLDRDFAERRMTPST